MNIISNGSWVGAQGTELSMVRDVFRIVITAVLAGTGFALLLALAVLSLTVIASSVQASGGPVLESSTPEPGRGNAMETSGKQDVSVALAAIQPAATPAVA